MKVTITKSLIGNRLFEQSMLEDPYPVYQRLRESDPVHWEESLSAWVLTRYDDVAAVLKDRRFSSDRVMIGRQRFPDPRLTPLWDVLARLMLEQDEPAHTRLRGLVHQAFVRTAVEEWEPMIRQRIDELLHAGLAKGQMDFIWDFAAPLPILIISELVGIPGEDRQQVKAWCDHFSVVALNFYATITSEQIDRGLQSAMELREYLRAKVDALKTSPRRDLLSSLVQAEDAGEKLGLDELLANVLLLLNAGNETTTCLLGNGLVTLYQNPEQRDKLRQNPKLAASAVEEFLRLESPVQFLGRIALDDIKMRGKTIKKGDLVLPVLAAANRDPEHFANPDELDIARPDNHHVAFGHGHHFCVGSQLARLEARLAFTRFLELMGDATLDMSSLSHREGFNLRCYNNLPLTFQ